MREKAKEWKRLFKRLLDPRVLHTLIWTSSFETVLFSQ